MNKRVEAMLYVTNGLLCESTRYNIKQDFKLSYLRTGRFGNGGWNIFTPKELFEGYIERMDQKMMCVPNERTEFLKRVNVTNRIGS